METLVIKTCSNLSGNVCKVWQTNFGLDGKEIISTCFNHIVNDPSIKDGDVVLLKDSDSPRNQWPIGVVDEAIPSRDSRVRKVQLKIQRNGKTTILTRPVSEIVVLISV
jgi:hypothetical protein